jgi:hypothetical protein
MSRTFAKLGSHTFEHSVENDYFFILRELKSDEQSNQMYYSTVLFTNSFIGVPVRLGLVLE